MNMSLTAYPQLQSALKQNKNIVYLCGAGLSMALGGHRYSWYNWIAAASEYLSADESEELQILLSSKEENALINAAGYVIDKTKENGTYNDYMNATVGSLSVKDDSLASSFQSINRAGDFIATTNYDLLIEQATGLNNYSYTQPGNILASLKGDMERKIIHLHGLYDFNRGVDEIIANSDQYDSIVENEGAQFIQNLLSTNTVVIIGCGATVDDPNLSRFLSFANKQLNISVPYFYLYKEDAPGIIPELPDNFIPVSYGNGYNDLPVFLNEITLYRLNHLTFSQIMRVNPYVDSGKKGSAYGRLHFSNEFSKFVGRNEELQKLNDFTQCSQKQLWWAVTGEGGYGKSRLLLEWLKHLPNDWFGFFGETSLETIVDYQQFKPFNNTIIVLDDVLGKETECARVISIIMNIFAATPYRLRIILVDRFYTDSKIGWYDTLINGLRPQVRTELLNNCFSGDKLIPLEIGPLSDTDEQKHIENYLESYVGILDADVKSKYTTHLKETALLIQEKFSLSLDEAYYRPLFLNIFVEVWLSKDGDIDVHGVRDLLGQFLEKETRRWSRRLGDDNELLYAYQILLAFASASKLYVLQDRLGAFQRFSDRLLSFVESEMVAGKRKKSLDDLFMYQEYARDYSNVKESNWRYRLEEIQAIADDPNYLKKDENGVPILLTILAPEYPDIILEFIVDYYIEKECWTIFAQEVREYENVFFNTFLIRGMEDFPDTEAFIEMYFALLKDPKDTFGFVLGALTYVREFAEQGRLPRIIDTLKTASMSKDFGLFELELWRRIAVVYSERKDHEQLYKTGCQFVDYIKQRKKISIVVENASEIIEGFCTELLKLQQPKLCGKLIKHFDGIAYDGYIATTCSQAYYYLINYQMYHGNVENVLNHLKGILQYVRKYPKDDDIVKHFVDATDDIREIINRNAITGLLNKLTPIVEQAYDSSKHEKIAEVLAVTEASRFLENILVSNQELTKKSQKRINKLFQSFKDNEDVILSYATVTAFEYLEERKHISVKELDQFRKWKDTYPKRTGLLEAYGKMLLTRWFILVDAFEEAKAKTIFKEVEVVAKTLAEQYGMTELLMRTIHIRSMGSFLDFYYL